MIDKYKGMRYFIFQTKEVPVRYLRMVFVDFRAGFFIFKNNERNSYYENEGNDNYIK